MAHAQGGAGHGRGWTGKTSHWGSSYNRAQCSSDSLLNGGEVIPPVPFSKADHIDILRPYPSDTGNAYVRRCEARDDMEVIGLTAMAQRLTHRNCELVNRPGCGLGFLGATVHKATMLSEAYKGDMMEKSGLQQVFAFFDTPRGERFCKAAKHVDISSKRHRNSDSVRKSLEEIIDFLASDELVDDFQRLSQFSAHMYTFSAHILQGMALIRDRKRWAQELRLQTCRMPLGARAFIARPGCDDSLVQALVAFYGAQVVCCSSSSGTDAHAPVSSDEAAGPLGDSQTQGLGDIGADRSRKTSCPSKKDSACEHALPIIRSAPSHEEAADPPVEACSQQPQSAFAMTPSNPDIAHAQSDEELAKGSFAVAHGNEQTTAAAAERPRAILRRRADLIADESKKQAASSVDSSPKTETDYRVDADSAWVQERDGCTEIEGNCQAPPVQDTASEDEGSTSTADLMADESKKRAALSVDSSPKKKTRYRVDADSAWVQERDGCTEIEGKCQAPPVQDTSSESEDSTMRPEATVTECSALVDTVIQWGPSSIRKAAVQLTHWRDSLDNEEKISVDDMQQFIQAVPSLVCRMRGFAFAQKQIPTSGKLGRAKAGILIDEMMDDVCGLIGCLDADPMQCVRPDNAGARHPAEVDAVTLVGQPAYAD